MSDTQWSAPELLDNRWEVERKVDGGTEIAYLYLDGMTLHASAIVFGSIYPRHVEVAAAVALLIAAESPAWLAAVEQEIWEMRAMVNVLRADRDATVTKLATARGLLREVVAHGLEHRLTMCDAGRCQCSAHALAARITVALDGAP